VTGALGVAKSTQLADIITFDMGGTSTDVTLVRGVEPRMSYDNQISAYPIQMPQLDIHTIGSGGGSIIWIGSDETLQVGPQSAGAVPGPACYGRGGRLPTISDANLLLGRLSSERPLSSGLKLHLAPAKQAFEPIAQRIGNYDVITLAGAAVRIAVAKMASAVREVSVHRGFDPREFSLVGFGGAGPMHVFEVAEELGMRSVMIPQFPGHICALGQMLSDLRRDTVLVWGGSLSTLSVDELRAHTQLMKEKAAQRLLSDGVTSEFQHHTFTIDMRYLGQSFTIPVTWRESDKDWSTARATFDVRHQETFGYSTPDKDVEIVNVRLTSIGTLKKPELKFKLRRADKLQIETRRVWFSEWLECPVFDRNAMTVGSQFHGPAIIEELGGTSVVPPGWSVTIHDSGALLCKWADDARSAERNRSAPDFELATS